MSAASGENNSAVDACKNDRQWSLMGGDLRANEAGKNQANLHKMMA